MDDSHQPVNNKQNEPIHDHLFNFTIHHDDEIPIVSFCNQVNQIGYIYQNELFKDHHVFSTTDNFTVTPLKDISNNTFATIQKEDKPPIDLFSDEFANSTTNYHMIDLLKSLLHPQQKNQEAQKACSFFSKIIKELEEAIKKVFDILKYVGDKLLIDLFANKNQINHISGKEWRNFGETLLNTPEFIFSDDANDTVGFLLYENGSFYHTDGKDVNKKIKIGLHFPKYFYSPITKEHLVAITQLATSKNKIIKLFGSCHSWSPIHTTNGILVDNRKILIDPKSGDHYIKINEKDPRTDNPSISYKGKPQTTVTTSPGITTGTLEKALWKLGYSLEASTIEDVFTMAGIGVTSSHGTGKKCTVLSDLVIAMTIVCSNGKVVEVSPQECVEVDGDKRTPATWLLERDGKKLTPEDIWRAAQVNLGAFGVIYDMTILVQPRIHALFVSQAGKWADYFGTEPSCAKNLNDLNNEWDTLEFWHFPFTVDNIYQPSILQLLRGTVTHTPYVTITKTMTNELNEKQKLLYDTVDKNYNSPVFVAQLAFQSVGAQFASRIWKWANTLYNNPLFKKVGLFMIKFIALMCSWVGKINWGKEPSFDSEGKLITKGEVWRIPQWIANHPVLDATAVVELIPVLDIEWEVPVPSFDEKGFTNVIGAFGNLIRNVKDRFENHNEFPVTINCEMRFLRGSNCPLSMQYNHQPLIDSEEGKGLVNRGFAAPEIVSNSPNPWWVDFYNEMNKQTTCYQQTKKNYGENIRVHHAKQFSSLDGMLKHLRGIYDSTEFSKYPNSKDFNTSFKLWKEVRTRFDQSGTFINPYIDQLFYNYQDTYNKPNGFEVSEGGDVQSHHHCSIL